MYYTRYNEKTLTNMGSGRRDGGCADGSLEVPKARYHTCFVSASLTLQTELSFQELVSTGTDTFDENMTSSKVSVFFILRVLIK